eukprot:scaffold671169_cov55-Prasinocladus_malaysianus.AAC.1
MIFKQSRLPVAGGVLPDLLLDVRHLGRTKFKRLGGRLALHRLQLGVLQRETDQSDGETVDEHNSAGISAGQEGYVRPEA